MSHIRKLLPYVKPYWLLAVLSFITLTAMVILDLAIPRLIQRIIDEGIRAGNQPVVLQTAALMLGISALTTAIAVSNNLFSVRAGEAVSRDVREALFLKIQALSFGDLDHFSTGRLMVRLSSDTTAFQRLVMVTLRIGTRAPLMMIGSLILMFNTNQRLALTMLPLLLVTSLTLVFFSLRMEPLFRAVQQRLDRLNTVLQENLSGVRLVKAFVRADFEGERFEEANEGYTVQTIQMMQFMSIISPVLTMFINVGIVLVVWAGGLQAIRGDLTIGEIVAFTNYMLTTMGPLTMMTMLANVWANGIASAQRINEVLDINPSIQEVTGAEPLPEPIRGRVVFEDVTFQYNGSRDNGAGERIILDDVDLAAEPGQMVAILGATGAGKTSLVHLIPRFYDVSRGRLTVDGHDVRQVQLDTLLGQVSIVPQETVLFSGSVRDNIRYGRPGATEAEVVAAAVAAQADEFIRQLPNGYDTHVEERGVNLSGGQKQRIAIARALVTRPRILILDDSTSSVDVETETKIQNALKEILRDTTTFVVAQRISTVLNADKIVVVEHGRIVAQGTHAKLVRTSPIYQEIYDSQLGNGLSQELALSDRQGASHD
jgi:ATP-binding cassette subfamily B protein